MTYPKFIITLKGHLRLGMVNLHKDLLIGGEQCLGGGYYEIIYDKNQLLLDGESSDFGPPLWHLIETLRVPKAYRGYSIVYKSKYDPDDQMVITSTHKIEYVGN